MCYTPDHHREKKVERIGLWIYRSDDDRDGLKRYPDYVKGRNYQGLFRFPNKLKRMIGKINLCSLRKIESNILVQSGL